MFKIVQTIEKSGTTLTRVPEQWEQRGVLYWPQHLSKKFIEQLRGDPNSAPQENWTKEFCKLKRSNFRTVEACEAEIDKMLHADDTDDNCSKISKAKSQKRLHVGRSPQKDFNAIADAMIQLHHEETEASNKFLPNAELQNFDDGSPSPEQIQNIETQSEILNLTEMMDLLHKIGKTQEEQCQRLANVENIIATISTKLDAVIRTSTSSKIITCNEIPVKQKDLKNIKKIFYLENLEKLENDLCNAVYMEEVIQAMTFVCGTNGSRTGLGWNCCYELIDYFFDRKFLINCSWTGSTTKKKSLATKIAFQTYKNTINCFFKIIHLADNKFSMAELTSFFQNILRNSTRRATSNAATSRSSTKRVRIKNNEKNSNITDANDPPSGTVEIEN